ncbi:MAG TPA: DMT family transporter, partial [Thermoplasmata archaeon]|nr:DMT family transporter [Thermoplasmata archaeon]
LLGAIWGSAFPVIRYGLLAGAAPLAFGVARFAGAGGLMALIALAGRERAPDRRTLVLSAVLGGGVLIGAYAAFLYLGEEILPGGLSSVLVATVPLWSTLVGFGLLPHERLRAPGLVGLLIGFVGVTVLFLPDLVGGSGPSLEGAIFVLLAALSTAIGSVIVRRTLLAPTGGWGLTVEFGSASLLLGGLALAVPGEAALPLNAGVVGSLLYLALVPSVVGYSIYFRLLNRTGPNQANLVAYINPVAGLAISLLLLGEAITLSEIVGLLGIVAGLFLVQRGGPVAPKRA